MEFLSLTQQLQLPVLYCAVDVERNQLKVPIVAFDGPGEQHVLNSCTRADVMDDETDEKQSQSMVNHPLLARVTKDGHPRAFRK